MNVRAVTSAVRLVFACFALALALAEQRACGQTPPLIKETFSREQSLLIGGDGTNVVENVLSREVSIFTGDEGAAPHPNAISREVSIVVTTQAAPQPITQVTVTPSPTGNSVMLNWASYNEVLQHDVVSYRIYQSDNPITSLSGLSPVLTVPAGTTSVTISNLMEFEDHYFAIVPVDALDGFDPAIQYFSEHVIAPEAASREYSLFIGSEPDSPFAQGISREMSLVVTTPQVPDRITNVVVNSSPIGDSVTLDWTSYNESIQLDLLRYNLYISSAPINSISGLTPSLVISGGTRLVTITNLPAYQDHFFALVPVDAAGGFDPAVKYFASYVIAAEITSREASVLVGGPRASGNAEATTREISIVVPDNTVPAPVTGVNSGFTAATSKSAFSAIDIDWSSYQETLQKDVVAYRVYIGNSFFTDVLAMTPYETIGAGITQHTVTGLLGGGIYYLAVVAVDALGDYNPSVRSVSGQASIGALGDVQSLTVISSSNSLHFSWLAPLQNDAFLNRYNVYLDGSTNPIPLTPTVTSYDVTNLSPATAFNFRISTVDTFGTESSGVTLLAATLLSNPSPITVNSLNSTVRLNWAHVEPNSLVSAYNVYQSASSFTNVSAMSPVFTTRGNRADIANLANGNNYFFAVTTVNISGGENKIVQPVSATPATVPGTFADLIVKNVTAPNSAYSGENITFNWAVTNVGAGFTSSSGGAPVSSWHDSLVLSSNTIFGDADDLILTNQLHSGNLSSGASYAGSSTLTLPTNLLGGFNIFVFVNADATVFENLDIATNIAAATHPIIVTPPVRPSITQQPQDLTVFQGRMASFTVGAQGSSPLLFQWKHGAAPIAGATNATLSISNVQFSDAGTYAVSVSNIAGFTNSAAATLVVNPPPPDLLVTSLQVPTNILAGQPVTFAWIETNAGLSEASAPWQEKLYLANNAAGTNPVLLTTLTISNSLAGAGTITRSQSVIVPAGLSGNYWPVVLVDSANDIPEDTGESNNYFVAPFPVFVHIPDLTVTSITAPASATIGTPFNASWLVQNIGNGDALGAWNDRLYLSASSNSILGATVLQTVPSVSPLPAGAGYTNSATLAIPLTAQSQAGNYWLVVRADADNTVAELTEADNGLSKAITLTLPPLPDLTVGQVASATQAAAGTSFSVSWVTTNSGFAPLSNIWRESLYLVPSSLTASQFVTNKSAYPLLGAFVYTNALAFGASIPRSEQVTVPVGGLAGSLRVLIFVDSDDSVTEQSESNNIALASNTLTIPAMLSLNISATNVLENTSSPNISCIVSRNGDLSIPLTIALSSSATNHLQVPLSVNISAGNASASFTSTVLDDGIISPDALVTLTAQASGYISSTSTVLVGNTDLPRLSFSLGFSEITEGQILTGAVVTDSPTNQPVTISLASSSPGRLRVPSSVPLPANAYSNTFTILAVDNTPIDPIATPTLSASAPGFTSASAIITVLDNDAPTLALGLNRTNISEGDGPYAAVGTITRSPVTDQPVTVSLASSNATAATVPTTVTIPSLQAQASFFVSAIGNSSSTGQRSSLITAQSLDITGKPAGSAAVQLLFVQDTNGPVITLSIEDKVVGKGLNPATKAKVSLNSPASGNVLVSLTATPSGVISIPASITISNGQASASFNISSLDDVQSQTSKVASITASASAYASDTEIITVTDLQLPDLAVTSISAPPTAYSGQPFTLNFRLSNLGLGSLDTPVNQNVYLQSQAPPGSNYLVGVVTFGGTLAPGQFADQFVPVPASAVPPLGSYWVIVSADVGNAVAELNEFNNETASVTAILVTNEFTATVKAGVTNVIAGTPVPFTGSATLLAGDPAANRSVDIILMVRGLKRVISTTTDSSGNFSAMFTPLQNEAGYYTVAAVESGIPNAPAQDHFTILGATLNPSPLAAAVMEGGSISNAVKLENLSELPLTALSATISGLAANLSASAILATNTLAGQSSVNLGVSVSALNANIRQSSFNVHLTSAEGLALDLAVNVAVTPLVARLQVNPVQLSAAMLRGSQNIVQFEIMNTGGAASGPLTVSASSAPWFGIASANPLPSLAPGASNMVTLVLTPALDLPLGSYTGALTVSGSGVGVAAPFAFNCVSDAHGSLRIRSVDEFTFFAADSPPLTNAAVTVVDPFSRQIVASGNTDTNGLFVATNLMEGIYQLNLSADKHASFQGSATVTAATTNNVEAFLSRQTVSYTWTVVPTQIEDVTHITVLAEFEANIPAPVVVPTPSFLDLASLQQPGQFMDVPLTLANYGLIAVHQVTISVSDHPLYKFDFLTKNIGDLPAHGSVTVPMRITRLAAQPQLQVAEPCEISLGIGYIYLCGKYDVSTGIPIPIFNVTGDCGGGGAAGGTFVAVGCNGCTGGPVVIPPGQSGPSTCDQCLAKALVECAIGFTPAGCPYGVWSCLAGIAGSGGLDATNAENCVAQGVGCLGPAGTAAACLWSFLRCKCNGSIDTVPACVQKALGSGGASLLDASVGLGLSPVDPKDVYLARSYPIIQLLQMILNDKDGRWFSPGSGGAFGIWFNTFSSSIQSGSSSGTLISSSERTVLMSSPRPDTVSAADVQAMIDRWNLSVNNWRAGILSITNVPSGGNTNFIDLYAYATVSSAIGVQYQAAQAAGYADPIAGFFAAVKDAESKLGGGGTCARVVLELDQDAVLTRDAFKARLELNNAGADIIQNIGVGIVVRNAAGQDVTSLFGIQPPTASGGLDGVTGSGTLQPSASGAAQWILIPSIDAAPMAATNYYVSGSFNYTLNGVAVTIPLSPAIITVQPNPLLYVKYFHQRDVFSDDPYTPQIEPTVPYSLAVMVQNKGYGLARNFHITSAQPKIVDNQKGLLIDFKIIGAQVGTNPVMPTLTADFGNIPPMSTKVGRWLLTSTLQGLFINYSATFEHVDPLNNPRLSLIDGVEIHEMNHLVRAAGSWDDGQPDFLVNDVPDFNNLPDTLYLSDGQIQPVSLVQSATPDAQATASHLQVHLSVNAPAGFAYFHVPDPAGGQYQLIGVTRADGTNFLSENFWLTDRTFIGLAQPPVRENILHLFDYHTNAVSETYTLIYASPSSVPQTNPPVSAVFALPPFSPTIFGVVWSGANYVGQAPIAYYDIFTSDNNAPFTVWKPHVTETGGLYTGQPGHTYAFYSVATDTAGNVEPAPITPDAATTVSGTNTPPTISFSGGPETINEGDTLSIMPTVSDSDLPPQSFSFALAPGSPSGVTINPSTGLLSWPTTEISGPSTNIIGVIVTDNGFPALSATGSVTVIVKEVNQAPILFPIANVTINEGYLLRITNSTTDYDLPANTLTYSLANPIPAGASIAPATGIFSWRPTDTQGPSTNQVTIVVTDNGAPPLSAQRTFTVTVLDSLSDLTLRLGSTNVLSGESNTIPLVLAASLDLTNLNVQLIPPGMLLTNPAIRAVSPEVGGLSLTPAASNAYTVNLVLNPALKTASVRSLASFDFTTRSNYHSSVAIVGAGQLLARDNTGRVITNGTAFGGRIIIVGREPVLDAQSGSQPQLSVYGRPGAIYSLLDTTNLVSGDWSFFTRIVQTNRIMKIPVNITSFPGTFFTALEFKAEPPSLAVQRTGPTTFNLRLGGWPGVTYQLETSQQLGSIAVWNPITQLTLTNSFQTVPYTNQGDSKRFFRGSVP